MRIVVPVKYVPDAQAARSFEESDYTIDRDRVDGLLSELDEYAVEEALKLTAGGNGRVVVLTMGPPRAAEALKKALQMGADEGVHVCDDALAGSDAVATSLVLAAAITRIGEVDLVLTGMASTDGGMGVVPAMLAERLGLPQLTLAGQLGITAGAAGDDAGRTVRIRRESETATQVAEAALPAVVSVTDQINEPRYPSFKGIMAAKKKPVRTWSIADLGVEAGQVGHEAACTRVVSVTPRPPRPAGLIVTDDGPGGEVLARYLALGSFY